MVPAFDAVAESEGDQDGDRQRFETWNRAVLVGGAVTQTVVVGSRRGRKNELVAW